MLLQVTGKEKSLTEFEATWDPHTDQRGWTISWFLTGSWKRKTSSVTTKTHKSTSRHRCCIQVHSQALKVVSPCEDWEVLHHTGSPQHPGTHTIKIKKNKKTPATSMSYWSKHGVDIKHRGLKHTSVVIFSKIFQSSLTISLVMKLSLKNSDRTC